MGGEHDRLTAAEAISVVGWWVEAGVDVAVQDEPRAWLGAAGVAPAPEAAAAGPQIATPLPENIESFRSWLGETSALPFGTTGSRRVLPKGIEAAEIMLLADMPAAEDVADGQPIGGAAWALAQRMLAAIRLSADQAYVANLSCVHSPGARLSATELEACAAIVRRQISLAKPRRLLLLGDGPCKALLGKPMAAARGHVHKIEGVRTVATFHPRWLLERASDKARAWSDLLLLMEDEA